MKLRFEPRQKGSTRQYAIMVALSLVFITAVLSAVFLLIHINPVQAIWSMVSTAFTSGYYFSEALVRATPMIFTSLAVAVCLRMRLWNIGAEGQLLMGAFGAVLMAQMAPDLPALVLIPLMLLSAMLFGGLFGVVVGLLKRWLHVNETLTSLLLNYVAASWLNYLIYGPWRDPANPGFPITARLGANASLPTLFSTRLHLGFILALLAAVLIWFIMEKTPFGFEIRATGESLDGARYAGIPINRNIVLVFLLAGALAALAGFGEVAGLQHKLQPGNVSNNYGSYGIILAWLSNANPLVIVLAATLGGILLLGSESLQISSGIASENIQITIGLLLVCILLCKFLMQNRIILEKKRRREC
jgi:ABC-type uncharacterized transport system permease subunit